MKHRSPASRVPVRQWGPSITWLPNRRETVEPPIIVAGDLNGEWKKEGSAVRVLAERFGLLPYRPEAEDLGTYKSVTGKRLDWILVSPDLNFVSYRVVPEVLSDHLAVVAEISLRAP